MKTLSNIIFKKLIAVFAVLFFTINAFAQSAANDPTFNPIDIGFGDGFSSMVKSTAIQTDGKIIVGGAFNSFNGIVRNYVARLNADGTLDASFNHSTGFNSTVESIAIQNDGKILVGGWFSSYNGTERNGITRLNTDGTLDTSFDPGTGFNSTVESIAIQNDGKILVGGWFSSYDGTERSGIARLNNDGSLDTSFDPGTGTDDLYDELVSGSIKAISIQSDDKIIIGGSFQYFNGLEANGIARLNTDGTLDTSFDPGTGISAGVESIAIQSDGKILIGGTFTSYNGTERNRIARLNANGTVDLSFNPNSGFDNTVKSITILDDDKVIIGGHFTSYNGTGRDKIAKLNADGTLDVSFNPGTEFNGSVNSTSIQNDGKILVGGQFTSINRRERNYIAKLNANGTLDASFYSVTGFNEVVNSISIQPDDKIIAGGNFSSFNGTERNNIARLNADGTLDASFDPGSGFNGPVWPTATQGDGKILVGGEFLSFNGTARNYFARLNPNGTLDASFNPNVNGEVYAITIQSDGKLLIGGNFTIINGTERNRIARLNTDGTLDTSFDPANGFNSPVTSISIQDDGKMIVGGTFTSFNGTGRNYIARLNANGTLDTSFNPGSGFNDWVWSTAIQNDGKIIVGGSFTSYRGNYSNHIERINIDGTSDLSFNPVSLTYNRAFNNWVFSTAIQSNGKIIIGGSFTAYNDQGRNFITRLNSNGSLDTSFDPNTGFNGIVYCLAIQSDGKIIAGGNFTSYNGIGRNRIARIMGDPIELEDPENPEIPEEPDNPEEPTALNNKSSESIKIYPNPTEGIIIIVLTEPTKNSQLQIYSVMGVLETKLSLQKTSVQKVSLEELNSGMYIYNIIQDGEIKSRGMLKVK
ncbi:MAG: T9SS type A sorting domain-containing protein [Cytophagaceae bacterium]